MKDADELFASLALAIVVIIIAALAYWSLAS